ncbi:MAG: RNA-directed DNA polymerase [Ruminococcus sp.]|nr:RNA-directed DNA polymerase [Ruminococcus sp.]
MTDRDVTELSRALGVPVGKLYMLSNERIPRKPKRGSSKYKNYHTVVIKKGLFRKSRKLSVPNGLLKMTQRRILHQYLYRLEASRYSTAYQPGRSLRDNASPHLGQEYLIKLDISKFFDNIDADMVYNVMRQLGLSRAAAVLLMRLCVHNSVLPQGAPTSPYIANLVMKPFDEHLGDWCRARGINYTRYCDDMTFSGRKADLLTCHLVGKVRKMLRRMGFELNDKKTLFLSRGSQQKVTGIVVNQKLKVPRELRRTLRQEVYYCTKFGAEESLKRRRLDMAPEEYLRSLLGRIAFALQIDPEDSEMQGYHSQIKALAAQK